jgi:hypothetical protein
VIVRRQMPLRNMTEVLGGKFRYFLFLDVRVKETRAMH